MTSLALLVVALVAVVGLAKVESRAIEAGVAAAGFPLTFVGVVIALLVLLPESIAAVRAVLRNRMQTSLNLALGSAMASIGLTIPTIAVASLWLDTRLVLGLGETQMVLLALTVVLGVLTVVPGRATRLAATTRRTPTGTGRVRPWFRRSGGRSRPLAVCRRACRLQARSPARSARLADGEWSRQARPPGAGYSGMFPCFLGGRVSRFERRRRSERTISERVSWGAMTAST